MLQLGMTATEVECILGKPDMRDTLSIGERWIYLEGDSTASWTYVAEFKREAGDAEDSLKLCYIINIRSRAFPDSERFEMGERLDLRKPEGTLIFGYPPSKSNAATN